jgi:hypothetical protein
LFSWFKGRKPSATLEQAVEGLISALQRNEPFDNLGTFLKPISAAANGASQAEQSSAMRRLADACQYGDLAAASALLISLGVLVESGGDPTIGALEVLARCKQALPAALQFRRAVQAALTEASAQHGGHLSERDRSAIVDGIGRSMPDGGIASNLLTFYIGPFLAYLPRNKAMRKAACNDGDFVRCACELVADDEVNERCFTTILTVLDDEELVVLYPTLSKGFLVRIEGITHNFQLHTLLADAIMGTHIPGVRPDPRVVAAARDKPHDGSVPTATGSFHLYDWTAIRPDRTVLENPFQHNIWHEGKPADIPMFEGKRIIVLAPSPFARAWNAPRDFDAMVGQLTLVQVLNDRDVSDWIARLAAAQTLPNGEAAN